MLLEELLKDECKEGIKEGIQKDRKEGQLKMTTEMLQMTLGRFEQLPDSLLKTLQEQHDVEIIKAWM